MPNLTVYVTTTRGATYKSQSAQVTQSQVQQYHEISKKVKLLDTFALTCQPVVEFETVNERVFGNLRERLFNTDNIEHIVLLSE